MLSISDEGPDHDEEEEEDEDDGEYNDGVHDNDDTKKGSDTAEDQPIPTQTYRDIFTQPVPADWEPTNPFQEQFLMFIQSAHACCKTEAVVGGVLRKPCEDQPIHQGAWHMLKDTSPEVLTCAILEFVPERVQNVLSLVTYHRGADSRQAPATTSSHSKGREELGGIPPHRRRQHTTTTKGPTTRKARLQTYRPKYLYATNARGLGTRKPISR